MKANTLTRELEEIDSLPLHFVSSSVFSVKNSFDILSDESRDVDLRMTKKVELVATELFDGSGAQLTNIKFFFQEGVTTAESLADYLMRVRAQVRNGLAQREEVGHL